MKIFGLAALAVFVPASLFAQSPFEGEWTLNPQKSVLTGETMEIKDAGNGAIQFVSPNFTTTVQTDGTKAQTPAGGTMAILKKEDGSYHQTVWLKGAEVSQSDWTLSEGDNTLTVHEYGTRPDGEKFDDVTTYDRVSGNNAIVGVWKVASVNMDKPVSFSIEVTGDQMVWDIPSMKATWKGTTDGKEYPAQGPTVPESLTLSVMKDGPNSLQMTEKLQGKTIFSGTYTIAPDGKTMTVEGKNAKGETVKEVWEKRGS